jgi:RimJ/RimL family protein N-acetyltransferase
MLETRPADMRDLAGFILDRRQAARMPQWYAILAEIIRFQSPIAVVLRGQVIAIAGLTFIWHGRAVAWCFLSADFPKGAWVAATRAALRVLDSVDVRRVEADIADGFAPAGRWAQMLGFRHEGRMAAYWSDGSDYHRWARVKA